MVKITMDIKLGGRAGKKTDKTEDQEAAQIKAEARASEASAEIEKKMNDSNTETTNGNADNKNPARNFKEKMPM